MTIETGKNGLSGKTVLVCCLLAVTVWCVFGQTLRHEFVNYDDDRYVYKNRVVSQGLSIKSVEWAFTHSHFSNWHPLTTISNMLDCALYGLNPGPQHLTNVLLHMATVILLFLILRQMTGSLWRSAFVAAVFSIHPLRVESVAWISARKDVLSGLFFMLTLAAYIRYVRYSFSLMRYSAVLLCFAFGLMSKPMLVTLPFVLLLLDYWPLGRLISGPIPAVAAPLAQRSAATGQYTISRLIIEKIPLFMLSAVFCVITVIMQEKSFEIIEVPLQWKIGNAVVSYAVYMIQMVYPVKLAVLYPHQGNLLPFWKIGLSLIMLAGISLAFLASLKKRPYLAIGWLWYLGMLVPVIGIIQVGQQAHADRYTYLPQIGLYISLTWAMTDWSASWKPSRVVFAVSATAILAALAAVAYIQTGYWYNNITLWTHTIASTSRNNIAHSNLGLALAAEGRNDEAIMHYEQALDIKPDDALAHNNLAIAFAAEGRKAEAIMHYEQALKIKPNSVLAHNNLGLALAAEGRNDEAIMHYEQALKINPNSALTHSNLAIAFAAEGRKAEAIMHYKQSKLIELKSKL
jgi:tetratricopeptide (TPR) repeat protein